MQRRGDIEEQSAEQRGLPRESAVTQSVREAEAAIALLSAALQEAHADVRVLSQRIDGVRDTVTDDDTDTSQLLNV